MAHTHVALLRGINVGGHKMVAMSDLRECVSALGFEDPCTLLQSGNLVFRSPKLTGEALERALAAGVGKRLGMEIDFFVRSAKDWQALVAANPFVREATEDPGHLIVHFLRARPAPKTLAALQAAIAGREVAKAAGPQAYIVYPDGMGRSRLTPAILDKHLGRGTARNWNTVLKVKSLLEARG